CGDLVYYPLIDTGWDSRPWHGAKALVLGGRTVTHFDSLLRAGKAFAKEHGKPFVVLGPINEWGEGSYIEPCTEFGFSMYEAIRNAFATGDPTAWPVNIGPSDVGLGPYDLPPAAAVTAWEFTDDPQGWAGMMGVSPLRIRNGCLAFETTSEDPAIHVPTRGLDARDMTALRVRMRIDGPVREGERAQLFWSSGGAAMTEATSADFVIAHDGGWRTYTLDLSGHPRWRGRITTLRFDPCATRGATVHIDSFIFIERAEAIAP
ncbi:MAG TPA: glycoside hydrolase family 99-like domain-containing protein, partial [Candidatus Hydrogenedentes bacterium]|nr:glycoside hydrolase family 99-like domain-containing protein [Candidatus Hydrogenedentota bacterium]